MLSPDKLSRTPAVGCPHLREPYPGQIVIRLPQPGTDSSGPAGKAFFDYDEHLA